MQIIKSIFRLAVFIYPVCVGAQTTYLPQGAKENHFIDRLEIKQKTNTHLNFSTLKPYSREAIVQQAELMDSARMGFRDPATGEYRHTGLDGLELTPVDEHNLRSLLMNSSEWVTSSREGFASKKPIWSTFYKTKANMLEFNSKDFFLAVNPVVQFTPAFESNNSQHNFINTRGATARGMIARKIGFSTIITENQERGPLFFRDRVNEFRALPGAGFYKPFKNTAYDYFDARGYITFGATKYIDFQFGYDKNFIGNGYRSMFLSDWGNSHLFLKVNTRIWKLNFQNLFMEVMPQFKKGNDSLLDRKYAAIHHLSMNVTKWLNIGLFEGVVFGRKNHFDFQYLNPVIFYRHIEGTIGSPDNALAGIDFKANIAHRVQLYGQFLLDEFILSEIKKNTGFWANKWGLQGGLKYIDAFGVNNLDIQLETNRSRPFTYSHNDTIANYTHYNQPLAHPLGANFQEYIAILKLQPAAKWYINARAIYYRQGLDSLGRNFGSNPMRNYITRSREYGFEIGSGNKADVLNTSLKVSYEIRENLFIEGSVLYRTFKSLLNPGKTSTTVGGVGVRWNIFSREYDY